jgi:phosphoglycerate dehydrogenase-like enzyme
MSAVWTPSAAFFAQCERPALPECIHNQKSLARSGGAGCAWPRKYWGPVARIGLAFGMKVVAWSQNLAREAAEAAGVTLVMKEELFRQADVVTIHLILSNRTRGLVEAVELAFMKPVSWLINTSRGAILHEGAVIQALISGTIAGAALDVFDAEPLPANHPFRTLDNVLTTPHIRYVAEDLDRTFYGDAVISIGAWLHEMADSGQA